jgi:hypothetical protein
LYEAEGSTTSITCSFTFLHQSFTHNPLLPVANSSHYAAPYSERPKEIA